ncbi:septal ring lytic transglycosylase RlpA family protein [Methylobacter sp.]|uniref:septal ring lytic transglycosylase RlpA family protein n=1 Tax=Methylobacter sp. TaxID=2051955 RepID=UPI003DA2E7FC
MNKIIVSISFFILSSCATEQIENIETSKSEPAFKTAVDSWFHPSSEGEQNGAVSKDASEQENLLPSIAQYLKKGIASWYGPRFHGKKTANGEIFDMYAMSAASKTLPIPSYARVTNLENKQSVIVRINDRGPYHGNRVLDLSYTAAKKLGIHKAGTGMVEIKPLAPEQALPQLQASAAKQKKQVYLQVGAFGSQRKALKLQNKIIAHHLPQPEILSSTYKKATLYKVQMGPIKSADGADKLNEQLAAIGVTHTQFVTETRQN